MTRASRDLDAPINPALAVLIVLGLVLALWFVVLAVVVGSLMLFGAWGGPFAVVGAMFAGYLGVRP